MKNKFILFHTFQKSVNVKKKSKISLSLGKFFLQHSTYSDQSLSMTILLSRGSLDPQNGKTQKCLKANIRKSLQTFQSILIICYQNIKSEFHY